MSNDGNICIVTASALCTILIYLFAVIGHFEWGISCALKFFFSKKLTSVVHTDNSHICSDFVSI